MIKLKAITDPFPGATDDMDGYSAKVRAKIAGFLTLLTANANYEVCLAEFAHRLCEEQTRVRIGEASLCTYLTHTVR